MTSEPRIGTTRDYADGPKKIVARTVLPLCSVLRAFEVYDDGSSCIFHENLNYDEIIPWVLRGELPE